MKKCRYCSNMMKDNDSFCSACGKSAEVVANQGKSKNSVAIVLIICVTLIVITAMLVNGKPDSAATDVYSTASQITNQPTTETVSQVTTLNKNEPTTVVLVVEGSSTKKETSVYTAPATTKYSRTYYLGSYYFPLNTPSKAGLVLRSGPSSSSVKLGVISEYEIVSIANEQVNSGYVYVYVVDRNAYGWVLADYLAYYGNYYQPTTAPVTATTTRYYPTTASVNCSYGYVTYDTPSDAGINLRKNASSSSELLCTIKEGETVVVCFPMSNDDYIEISYTNPTTGVTHYGWAMRKYIAW